MIIEWPAIAFGLSIIISLIGVVWKMLNNRIDALERLFSSANDVWKDKAPTIITSATRLDEMEKRLGRMEDSLQRWMDRIENKLDRIEAISGKTLVS